MIYINAFSSQMHFSLYGQLLVKCTGQAKICYFANGKYCGACFSSFNNDLICVTHKILKC